MPRILMEQSFEKPLTDEEQARYAKKLDECLELRRGAWIRSYLSLDRKRSICEFEAPDADSVRDALRSAAVPFDRVWPVDVYAVEDYPEHLARLTKVRAGEA